MMKNPVMLEGKLVNGDEDFSPVKQPRAGPLANDDSADNSLLHHSHAENLCEKCGSPKMFNAQQQQ